jgi:hypothetical protein
MLPAQPGDQVIALAGPRTEAPSCQAGTAGHKYRHIPLPAAPWPFAIADRRGSALLKPVVLKIDEIYVPTERRKELDRQRVESVAEEILQETEEQPIQVRRGKDRYVLVKGIHRLEARKALGEETIQAFIVGARLR